MSLGADEDDRDDLDFSMGQSQLIGELAVELGNNNKFSSHNESLSTDQNAQTVFRNPADERPIGGSGNNFYSTAYDERPINANATGEYDLSAIPLDEIELQDNYSEVEVATLDSTILDRVKNVYQDILNQSIQPFTKKKTLEVEEEASMSNAKAQIVGQRELEKNQIFEALGQDKYQEIYDCLVYHRSQQEPNEREMYEELKQKVGGVKEFLNMAFKLDNIVFHELILENLNK